MNFDRSLPFQSHPGVIPADLCKDIWDRLEEVPACYWEHRTSMMAGRAYPGETCDYYWTGNKSMPKDLLQILTDIAPRQDGWELAEVCVNKYYPGNYIGKHKDRAMYPINLIIPLQSGDDGVVVDDVLYKDNAGQANIFYGVSPAHHVPPVKSKRYLLIFLYTEKFQL